MQVAWGLRFGNLGLGFQSVSRASGVQVCREQRVAGFEFDVRTKSLCFRCEVSPSVVHVGTVPPRSRTRCSHRLDGSRVASRKSSSTNDANTHERQ